MVKRFCEQSWKDKMRIRLDVNNMFADRIGKEHGFTEEDIDQFQKRVNKAHENILKNKLGFMDLPFSQGEIVKEIIELVDDSHGKYDNFVVFGIGGSALGNIAMQTALNDPYYNYSEEARNGYPR